MIKEEKADGNETYSGKRSLEEDNDSGNPKRHRESRDSRGYRNSSGGSHRIELRILIPISAAGAIIGKGGSNIREMREKYNASIQIPDSQGVERVVNTSAFNSDDLSRVCGDIVSCVHENSNSRTQEVRLLVHKSQAGTIIGVKGFKIKELREVTSTSIKVYQDCCPHSTDRICQIRGNNDTIMQCVKMIIDLMESAPPKGMIQRYDPNNYDDSYEYGGYGEEGGYGMGGGGYGGGMNRGPGMFSGGGPGFMRGGRMRGRGGRGGGFGPPGRDFSRRGGRSGGNFYGGNDFSGPDDFGYDGYSGDGDGFSGSKRDGSGEITTTKVTIPTSLAGSIIGKGGQRIRQIRQDCGAQIKIDEPAGGSNDRIITITGTQEEIQNAQFLLQRRFRNSFHLTSLENIWLAKPETVYEDLFQATEDIPTKLPCQYYTLANDS